MTSSVRTSYLMGSNLDARLQELGAATFGSTERKRERLERFLLARDRRIARADRLYEATRQEQQRVQERIDRRIAELRGEEEPPLKRRRMMTEECPSPASAPAPVRRPSLPSPHRMVTRSARRNSRIASQNALERIRSVIAEFLA